MASARFCLVFCVFLAASCTCAQKVSHVTPSLTFAPNSVDFGLVKVGEVVRRTVTLQSQSNAPVSIARAVIEGPSEFTSTSVGSIEVQALGATSFDVVFEPREIGEQPMLASLVIESNDPEKPVQRVPLLGQGATALLGVRLRCEASRACPAIASGQSELLKLEFAPRRLNAPPIESSAAPLLELANESTQVSLKVSKLAVLGPDADVFSVGSLAPDGLVLAPQLGVVTPVTVGSLRANQQRYSARLVIETDSLITPRGEVELLAELEPNVAPSVCANVVRVVPSSAVEPARDYSTHWGAPLDAGVYDFTASRDVRPGDLVVVSALSNTNDPTACTSDAEDGRQGLSFSWSMRSAPSGAESLVIGGASTAVAQFRPVVSGRYQLELAVRDTGGAVSSVMLAVVVSPKQDLVAQLQWPGFNGVDFDLHLVRPLADGGSDPFEGVFGFFDQGAVGKTSPDLNGFSKRVADGHLGSGFDFDWGEPGVADDPRLNVDDTGQGALVENLSLDRPENDGACASHWCRYRVLVHAFKDGRSGAAMAACVIDGGVDCHDGDRCDCDEGSRCVADSAPIGASARGVGQCVKAPKPIVRLFFFGDSQPAAVIPLENVSPPDSLALGAVCQMLEIAEVEWPPRSLKGSLSDGGTPAPRVVVPGADSMGRLVAPRVARFGFRAPGDRQQCSPDIQQGGLDWYAREP